MRNWKRELTFISDAAQNTKRPREEQIFRYYPNDGTLLVSYTVSLLCVCVLAVVLCAANTQPGFIQPGLRTGRSPAAIGGGGGERKEEVGLTWRRKKNEEQAAPHTLKKIKDYRITDRVF